MISYCFCGRAIPPFAREDAIERKVSVACSGCGSKLSYRVLEQSDATSLQDSRDLVQHGRSAKKGVVCPCCDQRALVQRYRVHRAMARGLREMYAQGPFDWHKQTDVFQGEGWRCSDYGLMRHWRLIVNAENEEQTKRAAGLWQLTEKGRAFIEGAVLIPKYRYSYNNITTEFSDEVVTFMECLGEPFDFQADVIARPSARSDGVH